MNVNHVFLETVCGITSSLPENKLPEFAFCGRSNVGKSSLLNVLINRKSLARTSSQPGKTQTLNFYNIENRLYFTDLPGYGYAKVPLGLQEKWGKQIEKYLTSSKCLKAVFLLVDIRHEPSVKDKGMYDWTVYHDLPTILVATKLDKIGKSQKDKHIKAIRDGLHVKEGTKIIPFSSSTKQGREEIWETIEGILQVQESVEGAEPSMAMAKRQP